jgi:adenosylcobinamide kinase/adenosylcobinamide-phosphate guanylyltransferase
MAKLTLILGGARSGKTAHALAACPAPHCYIATAQALDGEMADRIAAHKAERGESWGLAEAPLDLAGALRAEAAEGRSLLVDCLTLWLSNLMHEGRDVAVETEALITAAQEVPGRVVMVSNEVGLGLVPMEKLSRDFRDAQGRLNQRVAAAVDQVRFIAAGLPLVLKGET